MKIASCNSHQMKGFCKIEELKSCSAPERYMYIYIGQKIELLVKSCAAPSAEALRSEIMVINVVD